MTFKKRWEKILNAMEPTVFFGSAGLVIAFIVFGGFFTETAADVFNATQTTITQTFGWYYALAVSGFLVFALWLLFSRFSHIKLGDPDTEPEFSYLGWFTMLFSAGMGIGIVFWGVAEPLYHYADPPFAEAETVEAAREAMRYTFFHWGLHPWAIYILFGVSVAYFHFRHDLPLAPRSVLYPLLGDKIYGPIGHGVDILCTVGTLLGVATSLGLGAMQINSGVAQFIDIPENTTIQVVIIAVITLIATISVVSGLHAGIQNLSKLNIFLAAGLMIFVLLTGPTVYLLETYIGGIGLYLQNLPFMSLWVDFTTDNEWQSNWTLFYWGWWISWSPFVGIFVARISRGRTIREFVLSVMIIPTLGTFFWLSVFGGTALHFELFDNIPLAASVQENVSTSMHTLLQHLPFSQITMIWATLVIIVFFITSSDSGSLVDDMVTSGGHPNPPVAQRVFWATSEGAVAATLLVVGGLQAIQDASISMGLLMSFLLVAMCFSLYKALNQEIPEPKIRKTELDPEE